MKPPNDAGHEATPEHGLHDGAQDVDETSEGTYVNSQSEDDDHTVHRHPEDEGSYVDVQPEDAGETVHPDPGQGHYEDIDLDEPDDDPEPHDEEHDDEEHD